MRAKSSKQRCPALCILEISIRSGDLVFARINPNFGVSDLFQTCLTGT